MTLDRYSGTPGKHYLQRWISSEERINGHTSHFCVPCVVVVFSVRINEQQQQKTFILLAQGARD